ncbi:MAG TPA: hypothetical protein VFQ85_10185 [Mycobacteriales bacterium]|jgi:hypothetical protein|nr:hypothetical protein [Mycobacteriales bacterium]
MTAGRIVVAVEPQRGDGHLREADVYAAIEGIRSGSRIRLVLADCETFETSAAGWLARWLTGWDVAVEYQRCGRRFAADWEAACERARSAYVDVELGRV